MLSEFNAHRRGAAIMRRQWPPKAEAVAKKVQLRM
jgi:hypothetical protein